MYRPAIGRPRVLLVVSHPGVGCVNPPPGSNFYPFYSTSELAGTCMWQFGGPYIPGTTRRFGGSASAEFGPLRTISYPTNPFGTVTKRLNDFRSPTTANPCKAATLPTVPSPTVPTPTVPTPTVPSPRVASR